MQDITWAGRVRPPSPARSVKRTVAPVTGLRATTASWNAKYSPRSDRLADHDVGDTAVNPPLGQVVHHPHGMRAESSGMTQPAVVAVGASQRLGLRLMSR